MNEAIFILGYFAGWTNGSNPGRMLTIQVQRAHQTAMEIAHGGAFDPLHVFEMKTVAKDLGYREPQKASQP